MGDSKLRDKGFRVSGVGSLAMENGSLGKGDNDDQLT